MNDLLDRLRARSWRLTAQRRVVAQALGGDNVHLTAEAVYERATELLPEISRATVYNTLNELVAMGEVAEVVPDGRANRYDPNVVHPHHHLHCTRCGSLHDVQASGVDHLDLERLDVQADVRSFRIDTVEVTFQGVCGSCQSRDAPS